MNIKKETTYYFKTMKSPVGELKLIASDKGLAGIVWPTSSGKGKNREQKKYGNLLEDKNFSILVKTEKELNEYFAKKRKTFTIKLNMVGTEFQKNVWSALQKIPFGQTRSYSEIAKQIGNPKAVRAVGSANGKNPLSIIIPCHRVIASSGKLVGFAGGLMNKHYLLELESKL